MYSSEVGVHSSQAMHRFRNFESNRDYPTLGNDFLCPRHEKNVKVFCVSSHIHRSLSGTISVVDGEKIRKGKYVKCLK